MWVLCVHVCCRCQGACGMSAPRGRRSISSVTTCLSFRPHVHVYQLESCWADSVQFDLKGVCLCLLTNQLTPYSKVLLEKLMVLQLIERFPTFCGTPHFPTLLTTACHLSLYWARWIQSTPSWPIPWESIFIFFLHLYIGLPSCLFPSGFQHNNPLCTTSVSATVPSSTAWGSIS
jgi:hypothetical protein